MQIFLTLYTETSKNCTVLVNKNLLKKQKLLLENSFQKIIPLAYVVRTMFGYLLNNQANIKP
jgi:hypothetical protein